MKRSTGSLAGVFLLVLATSSLHAQSQVNPPVVVGPAPSVANSVEVFPAKVLPAYTSDPSVCGFYGGGSFYMLRPYFQNNTAYRTTTGLLSTNPVETTTNFSWNQEPALALWAGYEIADGFGVRTRWFHFNGSSETTNTSLGSPAAVTTSIVPSQYLPNLPLPPGASIFGSPGLLLNSGFGQDNLTFSSSLRIETIDAEMTWDWNQGNWKFVAGLGGRFMYMNQAYHARLSNNLGNLGAGVTSETQTLDSTHNFYGGGPTVDFQANWRLGATNVFLYTLGRGSLLIGQSTTSTSYTQTVNDPNAVLSHGAFPIFSFINPSVANSANNVIPVTELELGFDYARDWGRAHWFARTAVVTQTYFGAGNASRTDGNFSMFGVQFSLGLQF